VALVQVVPAVVVVVVQVCMHSYGELGRRASSSWRSVS